MVAYSVSDRPKTPEDSMQIKRRVFLMGNLVLALSLTGSASQKQKVGGDPEIPTTKLVTTMRLLTIEQMNYLDENHRFANHHELLAFLRQTHCLGKSPLDLENPAPYQVQISTNPDATHYQITIQRHTDSNDKSTWCRTAAFSDDGGLIFLGQAVDCPAAPC
jgi:hypothetical protein